jgi:membrane protein
VGVAALYRWGPSRTRAKWRWITPGAVLSIALIIGASLAFSWYTTSFADFNATYGSLGTIIGFLIWVWLTMTLLLVGAELNSEIEHQTARDSTVGEDRPLGGRGATMADTVGKASDEKSEEEDPRGHAAAPPPRRRPSLATLAVTVPASLALHALARRRQDDEK